MINLCRKRGTALRYYLRARANNTSSEMSAKLQKKFEALRNDFMQTKVSQAFDTNKNGVWREFRNLGLLPQWVMSVTKSSHKPVRKTSGSLWWMTTTLFCQWSHARGIYGILQSVIARALPFLYECLPNIWDFTDTLERIFASGFEENGNTIINSHRLSSYSTALFSLQGFEKDCARYLA